MPFRLDYFKSGHAGQEYAHYMLFNIHKKRIVEKHFKTKQAAINFARNAIRYREKKDSKVIVKNNKTFILPKEK